ncbi:MAG: MerR family transcriptional regulator [Anaerolineales bacterium]|nr:MerR family transcriptional regulator [Anaerolineales bacterium]
MSPTRYLRTSELAKAANVHPNTVRLYEQWGLLPPVERNPFNNYRRFTQKHLDQLLLVRQALRFTWLSGDIHATVYEIIAQGVQENLGGALELAYKLLSQVQAERAQAEAAVRYLERWVEGVPPDTTRPLRIGEVARLLDVTIDQLRNWERNNLLETPRDPSNGYRLYGPDEIGRLRVIRMLIRSRYSTMSILRMLNKLDRGETDQLRQALDTPEAEEDVLFVTDHWLTTLNDLEKGAHELIGQIEATLTQRQSEESD